MITEQKKHFRFLVPLILLFSVWCVSLTMAATEAELQTFGFFTNEMELPPAAACGIMGTIKAESNFIPDIHGLGGAYGICQWTSVRITRLQSYCSTNGYDYRTLEGQLHFLQYEVETYFPKVLAYLKNVENSAEGTYKAGYYWCANFERPGDVERDSSYRASIARDTYWPMLGKQSVYLTASAGQEGVELKWQTTSGQRLALKRSLTQKGGYHTLLEIKDTEKTYLDKSAEPGETYYYVIRVLSDEGKVKESSNTAQVTLPKSVEDAACSIALSKTTWRYNGEERKPKVKVTYKDAVLEEGTDYTLSYENNINAGQAGVTVTGLGEYGGERKTAFTILKAKQVLEAKNRIIAWRTKRVTPDIQAQGKIRFVSRDTSVVAGKGSSLVIKGVGTARVVVKAKATENYRAASVTIKVKVIPPKPEFVYARSAGKGQVTLKWKSLKKAAGYQVRYATSRSFSGAVKKKAGSSKKITLSGLAGGRVWYFQVRSYRIVNGRRYYSRWSGPAAVTVL